MKTASVIFALAWILSGCGSSLGECDAQAKMGYDADLMDLDAMGILHRGKHFGQQVVETRCGTCHASTSEGALRVGAPAELDFDVGYPESQSADPAVQARVSAAASTIAEWKDDMWEQIDADLMPPGQPLSADEKVAVRNWLACGAEVKPSLPPLGGAPAGDNELEQAMLGLTACFGCHNAGAAQAFMTDIVFVQDSANPDVCSVYNMLTTGMSACGGGPLVTAGQPDMSHVIGLVEGTAMNCSGTVGMPAGAPLVNTDPTTVGLLRTWVMNGAEKPDGCP